MNSLLLSVLLVSLALVTAEAGAEGSNYQLLSLIDKVKYVHSLKEITVDIPQQTAVSSGW